MSSLAYSDPTQGLDQKTPEGRRPRSRTPPSPLPASEEEGRSSLFLGSEAQIQANSGAVKRKMSNERLSVMSLC